MIATNPPPLAPHGHSLISPELGIYDPSRISFQSRHNIYTLFDHKNASGLSDSGPLNQPVNHYSLNLLP
jgi:hypothetical protein